MVDQLLRPGAEIQLDEGQARHVGAVLRMELGDILRVFNATDGEWRAHVSSKTKRGMTVRVEELLRSVRATPDLDLLFAPVKRHATDLIVEKATELGVRRIRPVLTQRTIAETVRLDRLQAIAREAAEQTERFDAPEIFEAEELTAALGGWDRARQIIYADEAGDGGGRTGRAKPIAEALRVIPAWTAEELHEAQPEQAPGDAALQREKLALLIGPEGGFVKEERAMLRRLPFVTPVSLGPRILRAETAVIAALSVIQAAWGDWRGT